MPAWMEQRATHILAKNPSMPKSEAFALAAQQMHALGKSPEHYGTEEGREKAKAKFPTPGDDKKTANPGKLMSPKMEKKAIVGPLVDYALLGIPSAIGGHLGAKKSIELANENKPLDRKSHAAEWLLPGAIAYRGAKEQTHRLQTFANEYNAMAKELHEQKAKEKTALVAELARAGSRLIGHTPEAAAGVESAVRGGIGRLESGAKRVLNTPIAGTPEIIPGKLRGPLRKGVDFAIENPEVLLGTALPIPGGGALAHAGKRALERGINKISPPAPALMGKLAAGVEHYDRLKGKQKAAAAEAEQSFTERNPNLTQWGKATATGAGLTGAALGAGALTKQQATKVRPGDAALNKHLYDTASVPIERTVGEAAYFSPGAHGITAALGGPVEPHVKVPEHWRNPAVLAHELGHADIHSNRIGRMIQNPATTLAGTVGAGSIGALGGFASGFSDDKTVRRTGLLAPLAMSIPTLAYEAGASIQGLRKLRQGGAGFGQLANAAKMLAPAYGSYALRAARDTAGAAGTQAIGTAIHGSMKRRAAAKAAEGSKEAAGAPTRGGFMMASDIPSYSPPRLDRAIQKNSELTTDPMTSEFKGGDFEGKKKEKDGDALPEGMALQPWDNFKPTNINAKHAYASMSTEKLAEFVEELMKEAIPGLTPQSRLEQSTRIGAPRATPPVTPSIADQSKPKGPGWGSGIAGANKGTIGGTSVGGIGEMKAAPQL